MTIRNWSKAFGWLIIFLTGSCVEPYSPEVLEAPNNYLVVNGYINLSGPTTIQLLRTQNLNADTPPPAETGALITIESENGESYRLNDLGDGTYTTGELQLNPASKYRLFISTDNGRQYASDYVESKLTPAIDAVNWEAVANEVQFSVDTHDPNNKTKYYRWEFEETWQYRAALSTILKFENGRVVQRDENDEEVYNCWRSENSTTIELSNTLKLSSDVISKYKLVAIPSNEEKLAIKYSILVKQYALTREAYQYWEILKKNTENIGTLFDPLPSQLNSNIRSISNPGEPVIGFVSATNVQEKRIFVDKEELPGKWRLFMPSCAVDTMLLAEHDEAEFFKEGFIVPVTAIYPLGGFNPIAYTYAPLKCVDCRVFGTNVKPDFWK